MSIRSGQVITVEFTTRRFDTGGRTDADSTPTGTLYVNGTSNAASVTVTNQSTGLYKAAVTLPTLAVGDVVGLVITATVNSVTDQAKVWEDAKDVLLDSAGKTTDAVQTGDSFARIGVLGAGLTALAPAATALSTAQWSNALATLLGGFVFTVPGFVDANIQYVNDVAVTGTGGPGTEWGPA